MAIRVAINGYGRIGRNIVRALYESQSTSGATHPSEIHIVAINDLGSAEGNAHLTRYDSVHGRFNRDVRVEDNALWIDNDRIMLCQSRDPLTLPWGTLGVDVVMECTGVFTSRAGASQHLEAGAQKVLISAPASDPVDATIVYGVNHGILKPTDRVVSNASCTTNCLAPLIFPLQEKIGIETGLMNTIHAYTNDQSLTDGRHSDLRRARAAAHSMIPSKTGAAAAIGLVIPELNGKLDGFAIRVPVINVSVVDFTFVPARATSVQEINSLLQEASLGRLKGILGYTDEPLVSVDFNHTAYSSVVDSLQTKVKDRLVKVLAWYDNEWGFSNRMLDTVRAMMGA
jgi:glyceraldehyde 3-phosphate dehydrogenase